MEQKDVYQKLSERIFLPESKLVPELWRMVADEEEASILLATPATAETLSSAFGCSIQEMEDKLRALFRKGVIFKKNKPEGTIYRTCRDVSQFHDASILWPEAPKEFLDLWKRYMHEEWPDFARTVSQVLPRPFTRVVPVEQDVEARSRILACEDVERILRDSGRVAVANCTCRLIEGNCDKPIEVCLQVGRGADYAIERGSGREISFDEAVEILRTCEEAGLVHVTMNRSSGSTIICNCCSDCCMTFTLISKGINLCDPSRFLAVVDEDKCSGCATCLDRCFFGAISMIERDEGEVSSIDGEKCMGCGLCLVTCPEDAIALHPVRDEGFIPT
jgi:Pyruvate/2-oxoacid:ferredoxin oxidoreductase delta subunit